MKKELKKLIVLTLIGILCFGLFGCGKKDSKNGGKSAGEENKTEKSALAESCTTILATGTDKDGNFYELVGNEKEDYNGTITEIGAVKNGEWSVKPTSQSKFVSDGKLLVGEESVKDNDNFKYIGNACFHYRNILFNADKNLYYVGAVDTKNDDMETANNGDEYVPIVSDDGLLEDDDYTFGAGHNISPDQSCFVNNEGKVLLYDNGTCMMLDTSTMQKTPISFNTDFDDSSSGQTKTEYHTFIISPYSEGLIGLSDPTLGNNRDGFYDIDGNRVIDLSKYTLADPNYGHRQNPLIFKDGKCTINIVNDQNKEYEITLDKTGNVIESHEVADSDDNSNVEDGEDY